MQNYTTALRNLSSFSLSDYFHKDPDKVIVEKYFFVFSSICVVLLSIFSLLNLAVKFYAAFWIDFIGIISYVTTLYLYRRSLNINNACALHVITCCLILFFQSIILEPDAYHNMFFFPAVAIFCFALFDKKKYTVSLFLFTCLATIASYIVPKYFNTTMWYLTSQEKSFYNITSVIASLYATYKIGAVLYQQKEIAYQKLNSANREIEAALDKNKKLLQLIIHDISNPLFHIDFALQAKLDDVQKIERVNKLCKPAISTIKDIIELSRQMMALEDGKIICHIQNVNLINIIEEAEFIFSEKLRSKNIQIKKNFDEGFKAYVLADPKPLRASIINNVLSNAIKFSHPDSVISIELSESDQHITLKVKDDGIGIPAHLLTKIFKAEETTTRTGTKGETGTGYGLPLAKAFMKSLGGEIFCESPSGKGTCITLQFLKGNQDPTESSPETLVIEN